MADPLDITFDEFVLVDAPKLQNAIQQVARRYKALVQVVVSPDAARAEAATAAAAEAAAAARREKHKAEKKLERAARKEAERRARKEQKHLERRAHLEKLALGCFGTSDVRPGEANPGNANAERLSKPPSAKKRPPSAGVNRDAKERQLSQGQMVAAADDDDFAPPKKAHSGARAEKENSVGGRSANVPAAVAGEGITRKPHLPKPHHGSVSSAKRKALKQTTLSFSKKPNTALGPSPAADADEEDPIVMSEEHEVIID